MNRKNVTITDLVRHADGSESWTETTTDEYGSTVRKLTAEAAVFTRSNCYCCSCSEQGGGDPYCRNHGFAGTRPCEAHGMAGAVDDGGKMPESIEAVWKARAAAEKAYQESRKKEFEHG